MTHIDDPPSFLISQLSHAESAAKYFHLDATGDIQVIMAALVLSQELHELKKLLQNALGPGDAGRQSSTVINQLCALVDDVSLLQQKMDYLAQVLGDIKAKMP